MDAKDKIAKARATLVLDNPFFGALALRMDTKEVGKDITETMATDGIRVVYNADYVDKLTLKQTVGVMAHEVLHIATEHHLRRKEREIQKWNVACDYAINDVLVQDKFELPDGALTGWGKDEPAEEIYKKLQSPPPQSGGGGIGDVMDMPGSGPGGQATQAEKDQASAEMKIAIAQAAQTARACGKLSANMERLVGEVLEPQLDWKELLRQFIDRNAKNDYAWYPPNRKYVYMGIYLPSVRSETLGKIAVIVDTSGSISSQEINDFAGEISGILESHRGSAKVIYCDAGVDSAEDFEFDDLPLKLNPTGGGGTDFRPGFEYIDEHMTEPPPCAVYLTDGWCNSYPEPPSYPVLWVCTEDRFEPPFGEVLFINQERN